MSINKLLVSAAAGALILGSMAIPAFAKGPSAPAGNSNEAHLYLYEKDPSDWSIVDGGAWGKMVYNLSGPTFDFVFNGKGLNAGVDYSLIYYKDPWPGTPATCLASGVANGGGNVHLAGSVELNHDLKDSGVASDGTDGAKIWLVQSSDVNCGTGLTAWNPTEYLFEGAGIFYDDTEVL